MIRVLLVDDQELVRAGLRRILRPREGIEVIGECDTGAAALAAVAAARPDVVVMDATRRLRQADDPPPVLVLTTFGDDEVLSAALRAGAAGFQLKDAPGEDIVRAVRAVARGGAWLDPEVTERVLRTYRRDVSPPADAARIEGLTARELDVLRLIGRGSTNQEIADLLHVNETTVKTHVGHIFDKLGLRDRAGAIVFAFDHGLVRPAAAPSEDPAPG